MPDNQDQQWQAPQQSQFPQGQPNAQQWQQPQQQQAYPPQQGQSQYPQPPYPQSQAPWPQQQQMPQQYGQNGDFTIEQPQPNYGQMPYGQYGPGYGMGQPQQYNQGYNPQFPGPQGGYDPLAKNAYISLGTGVVGMLLLLVGYVWGIIFCCLGISLGIKGLYSRARVASIIGIVLNSISLIVSILVFVVQCSELMS